MKKPGGWGWRVAGEAVVITASILTFSLTASSTTW